MSSDIKQKICVLGLGYIGLPTAALLANRGFQVHGVDVTQSVVDTINRGEIHIVEPALDTFVTAAVASKKLIASLTPVASDVFIIAVPTPFKGDHQPDISYVETATRNICPVLKKGDLIILESTSPVGTTERIAEILRDECSFGGEEVYIAHCPERVLPGQVMKELIENDRIVGGINPESTEKGVEFYSKFVKGEIISTDSKTAELCKLVENSSRDAQIAFANELSMICDKAGIDVWELIRLANHHPRVNILNPGVGVGGHCIAVDPWFIVSAFPEEAKLIRSAREVNNYKTDWVIEKIKSEAYKFKAETGLKPKVAFLGLAFKPNIDDLRESPAVRVADYFKANHESEFDLLFVEPNIKEHDKFEISGLELAKREANVLCLLVAHKEFSKLNIDQKVLLNFCG